VIVLPALSAVEEESVADWLNEGYDKFM